MRAIVVEKPGQSPVAAEFPDPEPAAGEQELELVAAGVHWVVRSLASGQHYGSQDSYPLVPGVDAVARTADGRLVFTGWVRSPWGTMAERLAAPVGLELPDGADPLAIAAGLNPGMSCWLPLVARKDELGSLGTVLVIGATGMAGRMAAQAALHLGAHRVVGVGRDPERLAHLAELGITTAHADAPDPARAIAEALDGSAPSLVLDYVWGSAAEAAFGALARRGMGDDDADITYTQIGSLGGPTAALPGSLLRSRRIRIVGSGAGSSSTQLIMAELPQLMGLITDGTLSVPYTPYSFDQAAEAWAAASGARRAVITP